MGDYGSLDREKGVCKPLGFHASGTAAGIKESGKDDLGLLYSSSPCAYTGVFTRNTITASCVERNKSLKGSARIRAVICNSGNANSCTGEKGREDNEATAQVTAQGLGIDSDQVLTASTGIIGKKLPVDKISNALDNLNKNLSESGNTDFAKAIMTTDLVEKQTSQVIELSGGNCRIGGCAKGSGMIHPDMATMLGFITTDAALSYNQMSDILSGCVKETFNNLTVDGDTSTNDMVLFLANGLSEISLETEEDHAIMYRGVEQVCRSLCRAIAADGEGATKSIEITVSGGKTRNDTVMAAKSVAGSNLVKTAVFGADPNWGRIVSAVGYSGASLSQDDLCVSICGVSVFTNGKPADFDESGLSELMKTKKEIPIDIVIGKDSYKTCAHTCDLTYDYIKINAEYHT